MTISNMDKKSPKIISYIYLGFILLLTIITMLCLIFAFTQKEEKIVNFSDNTKIDDTVILKDNNYFEEKTLKNQKRYITSLVDSMKLNFKYKMSMSTDIDYNLSYYVVAKLKIFEVDQPENIYWSNEETLIEKTKISNNSSAINIAKSVDVDFNRYNQKVIDFSKDYALLLDSTLDVELHVLLENDSNKNFNRDKVIKVSIPMNKQSFSITKDSSKELENVYHVDHTFNYLSCLYLLLGIILAVVDGIFIKRLITIIKTQREKTNKYQKQLKKILKVYDQIIVTSKNMPDISVNKKIEVENFEELLDAQEELRIPIIFYENIENHESVFVIISDDTAWIYRLIDHSYDDIEII